MGSGVKSDLTRGGVRSPTTSEPCPVQSALSYPILPLRIPSSAPARARTTSLRVGPSTSTRNLRDGAPPGSATARIAELVDLGAVATTSQGGGWIRLGRA